MASKTDLASRKHTWIWNYLKLSTFIRLPMYYILRDCKYIGSRFLQMGKCNWIYNCCAKPQSWNWKKNKISDYLNLYLVELYAVLMMCWCPDNGENRLIVKMILISSDSVSATNQEDYIEYIKSCLRIQELGKSQAHAGIPGNEREDKLAEEAVKKRNCWNQC